jgi:hypothetical protein
MKEWFRKFFSDENTVNENTVLGLMSFMMSFGFACFQQEVPMWGISWILSDMLRIKPKEGYKRCLITTSLHMEYRGAGMEWIEILLGTGLLGTVAGFIYREGKHRERFVIMEKRMDLQDEKWK